MLNALTQRIDKPDVAKLLLRLTFSGLLLFHGIHKALPGGDLGFIEGLLAQAGLPTFIAWGVFVGEILCPILIILGILTRWCAIIVSFTMFTAVALANGTHLFSLAPTGAWIIESAAFYFLLGIVIFLLGGGRYSVMSNPDLR
jgi:Predicted membrane protein